MNMDAGEQSPAFTTERFPTRVHDTPERLRAHVLYAVDQDLPLVLPISAHDMTLVAVGSSPSVKNHIEDIRGASASGEFVSCVNAAHDWLIAQGIVPNFCVLLDSSEKLVEMITPHEDVIYLVASQCHPSLFNSLRDNTVLLWHAMIPRDDLGADLFDVLRLGGATGKQWAISGGSTAMLRTVNIGKHLGFRRFKLYGLDSSYAESGEHHVSPGHPVSPLLVDAQYGDRTFLTNNQFAVQAHDFEASYLTAWEGCRIDVIGDGLIPHICQTLNREKYGS